MSIRRAGSRFSNRWAIRGAGSSSFRRLFLDLAPEAVAPLAFRQVEFGRQLRESLKLDGVEILIVAFDDLLLIRRVVGQRDAPLPLARRGPRQVAPPGSSNVDLIYQLRKCSRLWRSRVGTLVPSTAASFLFSIETTGRTLTVSASLAALAAEETLGV